MSDSANGMKSFPQGLAKRPTRGILKPRDSMSFAYGIGHDQRRIIMAHPVIDADECIACGVCIDDCPQGVLELQDVATVVDEDSCIACGVCQENCPAGAITEIAED